MQSLALVIHVALAIGVIGLVLVQHGKGADAGAAFGSGASATVFGSRGSASFMTRMTTVFAFLFFTTSLFLFYLAAHRDRGLSSVTDSPSTLEQAPVETDLPPTDTIAPAPADSTGDSDLPAAPEADSGAAATEESKPAE